LGLFFDKTNFGNYKKVSKKQFPWKKLILELEKILKNKIKMTN